MHRANSTLIRTAAVLLLLMLSLTAACSPTARRPGGRSAPGGRSTPGGTAAPGGMSTPSGTAAPGTPGTSNAVPSGNVAPGTTSGIGVPTPGVLDSRRVADDIRLTAQSVGGVSRAHVVIFGNTALVGIETSTTAVTQPGLNGRIEQQVASAVSTREPRLGQVYVTTKPDLVSSLQRVSQGMAAGRPVSQFTQEIARIVAQLAPARAAAPGAPAAAPAGTAP